MSNSWTKSMQVRLIKEVESQRCPLSLSELFSFLLIRSASSTNVSALDRPTQKHYSNVYIQASLLLQGYIFKMPANVKANQIHNISGNYLVSVSNPVRGEKEVWYETQPMSYLLYTEGSFLSSKQKRGYIPIIILVISEIIIKATGTKSGFLEAVQCATYIEWERGGDEAGVCVCVCVVLIIQCASRLPLQSHSFFPSRPDSCSVPLSSCLN